MKVVKRILAIVPAILVQLLWLKIVFDWLAPWAGVISVALSILSFLFVLYIITKQEEVSYKILWLLVILTFPIPGALLYLIFGNKRTTRPLRKMLNAVTDLPGMNNDGTAALDYIAQDNPRMSQTFRQLSRETGFPTRMNESACYYPLGDDAFPVMLEEMEKAEHFIFVEYFIIAKGVMWDTMVELFARKAAQGVDVRVMFDDLGSISTYSLKDAMELKEKNIRCISFNPLVFLKGTLNYRDHRKMLIIDGKVAFSGGINLADEYINHIVRFGHWKDVAFRITGEAVENYTLMFTEFWNAFSRDKIPYEMVEHLPEKLGFQPGRDGAILSYYDSPLRSYAASNELFVDLLSQAKDYAWFYTPYLLPGDALLGAFSRAARRGVDVRIIMPGIPDKKMIFRMSRSFYRVLVDAGVKIYEYTPGFIHAKACVIDDVVGSVGTVNLDYRSLFLHFENNSLFYKASILQQVKQDFLETQAKCVARTKDTLPSGLLNFIVDGVLRIFTPLC